MVQRKSNNNDNNSKRLYSAYYVLSILVFIKSSQHLCRVGTTINPFYS